MSVTGATASLVLVEYECGSPHLAQERTRLLRPLVHPRAVEVVSGGHAPQTPNLLTAPTSSTRTFCGRTTDPTVPMSTEGAEKRSRHQLRVYDDPRDTHDRQPSCGPRLQAPGQVDGEASASSAHPDD